MENSEFTKEIQFSPFNSSKLNSSPKFSFLRSEIENYYKNEPDQPKNEKSFNWKKNLIMNLYLLLNEILMTPEPIQQKLLKTVYKWYKSKTKNPYKLKVSTTNPYHINLPIISNIASRGK